MVERWIPNPLVGRSIRSPLSRIIFYCHIQQYEEYWYQSYEKVLFFVYSLFFQYSFINNIQLLQGLDPIYSYITNKQNKTLWSPSGYGGGFKPHCLVAREFESRSGHVQKFCYTFAKVVQWLVFKAVILAIRVRFSALALFFFGLFWGIFSYEMFILFDFSDSLLLNNKKKKKEDM